MERRDIVVKNIACSLGAWRFESASNPGWWKYRHPLRPQSAYLLVELHSTCDP